MNRLLQAIAIVMLSVCSVYAQQTEMEQDIKAGLRQGDRLAVVAVHTGSNDPAVTGGCIHNFNTLLANKYSGYTFREAWTDLSVLREAGEAALQQRSLRYVLEDLRLTGHTHILIQPSFFTDNIDMKYARHEAAGFHDRFRQLRIGTCLLTSEEDCRRVARVAERYGIAGKGVVNILICGDEDIPGMTLLDYILRAEKGDDWMVVSTAGFPSKELLVRQLKQRKAKKANLIHLSFLPLAMDDLKELRDALKSAGIKIQGEKTDLCESYDFLNIFTDHAEHAQRFRTYSPVEIKMQQAIEPR